MSESITSTYATVSDCFERVYSQLRDDSGEHAPDSCTWIAPTLAGLREECPLDLVDKEISLVIGDGETIGWSYQCNGMGLAGITATASEDALIAHFGKCMGYDL